MSNRSDVFNAISRYKDGFSEYDDQKIKDAFLWPLQYFSNGKVMLDTLVAASPYTVSFVQVVEAVEPMRKRQACHWTRRNTSLPSLRCCSARVCSHGMASH